MGEKTPATQTQNSKTDPWAPAQPFLQGLLGKYGSLPTDVTGGQSAALDNLVSSTSSIPSFGNQGAGALSNLFSSDPSSNISRINSGFDTLNSNIGGTASGAELNPYSTPGFGDAMSTMMDDITTRTKGVYNASGRDPSGAGSFAQSLGRGLTQGAAPILQSQFNTNKTNQLGAAGTLYNAGNTSTQGIAGLQQMALQNGLAGINGAGALTNLFTSPAQAQLNAANAQYQQPIANLSPLLQAGTALGGMGGSSSGVSTSAPANDPFANIMGGLMGGAGLLFSDERLKEDVEKVGELHDGQNVYSYRYKGSDVPQIGLLAQEVLENKPEAVHDVGGGILAVDYKRATSRARQIGMLGDMRKAA